MVVNYIVYKFVSPAIIEEITSEIKNKKFVDDVVYDQPLIAKLSENVKKISFWVLVISSIFLLIAILLINSSIRLSVYAKRFTIKTIWLQSSNVIIGM